MAYLISLFLILAIVFSATTGTKFFGDIFSPTEIFSSVKNKVSQTLFPKTAKEIIIDNINSDYQNMDKFFSETAPALLNSKTIFGKDKATIQKAIEAFNRSKSLVSNLSQIERSDKGIVKALINKVLNLNEPTQPDPTNIPPQCRLECSP